MFGQYHCLHIPTGHRIVSDFNPSQHPDLDPLIHLRPAKLQEIHLQLINRWNASLPGIWQYWLA